jgi:uncharacterized protein (DUF2384 family)
MQSEEAAQPERGPIIAKAFYRAADSLGVTRQEINEILGVSEPTISRHRSALDKKNTFTLDPKKAELALLFLRIYRSLFSIFGNEEENARKWYDANNLALGGKPRDLVKTIGGLVSVAEYLDAMRGKV